MQKLFMGRVKGSVLLRFVKNFSALIRTLIFQVVLVAQLIGWIGQFIGHGAFEVNH